jgi:uroporphyrin-III C-methyltransferase/precorrin-2 dehydrogenase/sirohydrochlorin ferrochelatase
LIRYYPLEFNLHGKSVLMVGGGSVAARKLPELLACGAQITLVAPELCMAVQRLLPSGVTWHSRKFDFKDVEGQYLVFACTNDPETNMRISSACAAGAIPCNRADDAASGDFIVPGVIRRGAVTVSVSSSGLAPSLTRELKQKLSAFLGPEWASLAERAIARRGEAGRSFPKDNFTIAIHPVFLVGAGPGDRSLLTLGAAEALGNAEVLIHDRLVAPEILELVPATCQRISAEKRGHFESVRQEHINQQIIAFAAAGKRVVRLKGGDPFVFGRGYEEALALEAAGIPWRVVPGITSAIAVPALAGIPITHRGVARSFAVASGMAGGDVNQDFPKADTLVLLMALYRLDEIVPALVRSGYAPEVPVAAIQSGGLPEQRTCRTTLERLREDTARLGFDSPTLLVIGEVVNLPVRVK